jgi:hypothetical protein
MIDIVYVFLYIMFSKNRNSSFVGKCLTDSVCLSLMESTKVKMEGSECASIDKQEQRRLRRN